MKTLTVKLPKTYLDGMVVAAELDLGTLAPVTIIGASIPSAARVVICKDTALQQKLINYRKSSSVGIFSHYQMMDTPPEGVLFELASNIIWSDFDFTKPPVKDDQRVWLRYPLDWQPAVIRSNTGKLPLIIEARCGNVKHKATIVVHLHIQG